TNLDIERLLTARGVTVDRRRILLEEPIKQVGTYPVVVQIGRDVRVTVQVIVEAGDAEHEPEPSWRAWSNGGGGAGRRARIARPPGLPRTPCRAARRAAGAIRSRSTPSGWCSSATATASSTRALSGGSSTRRRSSSTTRATTTGRG